MTTSIEASTLAAEFSALKRSQQELIVADGLCPRISELLPGALHELVALGSSSNPLAAITAELDRRRLEGRRRRPCTSLPTAGPAPFRSADAGSIAQR